MFGHQDDEDVLNSQQAVATQSDDSTTDVNNTSNVDNSGHDVPKETQSQRTTPVDSPVDNLLTIKQQALSKLSPLIGNLEQSPVEEFNTLMMMIQASDDQSLIEKAYQAALNIGDEKQKAQALLDVVNEINYFTHKAK